MFLIIIFLERKILKNKPNLFEISDDEPVVNDGYDSDKDPDYSLLHPLQTSNNGKCGCPFNIVYKKNYNFILLILFF